MQFGTPPPLREAELLSSVKNLLSRYKAQNCLSYRRIHTMPVMRGSKTNMFYSRNTDMRGMEDLQIYLPEGKIIFVELKTEKGKQSEYQKDREAELLALGHYYYVVRNIGDMIKILESFGVPNLFSF